MGICSGTSTEWLSVHWNLDRIRIWKCWFFRRGENRRAGEKLLGAEKRTNDKLNPHIASSPRIDPEPHRREANALTTAPSLLPNAPKPTPQRTLKMESNPSHIGGRRVLSPPCQLCFILPVLRFHQVLWSPDFFSLLRCWLVCVKRMKE